MLIDIRHNYTFASAQAGAFAFALFGCEINSQIGDLVIKGPWGEFYLGEDHGRGLQLWKGYELTWQTEERHHRIPRIDRIGRFRWARNMQHGRT